MLRFAPLVFASCLLFQGCVPEADPIIDVVSVEQARVLIETNDDLIILDVRTPEEFGAGHIDNATNIDVLGEDFRTDVQSIPKTAPLLVYCRSGRRAAQAVEILQELGHTEVHNMSDRWNRWMDASADMGD